MQRLLDLVGRVFGRLTVLSEDIPGAVGTRRRWHCACVCGVLKSVAQQELMAGETRSCGCIRREQLRTRNNKHGASPRGAETYTYKKWKSMYRRIAETHLPRNKCYIGVTVISRWGAYENFLSDMGECPQGYSLDRIDNAKGYAPDNCRWVPLFEQGANTSRNRVVSLNGVTKHVSALAREVGLSPDTVFDRINKLGWSEEKALSTPRVKTKTKITPDMVQKMLQLSATGISQYAIAQKLGLSQGGVSLTLKKHKGRVQDD